MLKMIYVSNRDQWRDWLAKHHVSESEIWLIYYKKHSTEPRIPYDHAVEEALCYGWIDSTVRRLDDERYAQKFTPRRDHAKWSPSNLRRMHALVKEGRMTEAGLAKIEPRLLKKKPPSPRATKKSDPALPAFVKKALMASPKAWAFFQTLAPSYRELYVRWISSAKKDETRKRRLKEALSLLEQNKKLGMK